MKKKEQLGAKKIVKNVINIRVKKSVSECVLIILNNNYTLHQTLAPLPFSSHIKPKPSELLIANNNFYLSFSLVEYSGINR